ncbi:MAG: GNAT family N-acetyltransferase [Chloroflexota bacterium]
MDDLDIRPLTADLWDSFAGWFGSRDASSDSRWCWCAYWRKRGLSWSNSTADDNRSVLRDLVPASPDASLAPGLVALRGERPVGWVSLGPRESFDRLEHAQLLARVDDKPVWSIVCFVVARSERGRGIATALLKAAVEYARDQGATLVESYPVDAAEGRIPAASAYTGAATMFERAGFEVVATRRWNAKTRPRRIMRRAIARPRRTAPGPADG